MNDCELFSYYEMILDKLNSRELSGDEAINQVSYAILNLENKSADLFQKIINKDLRIGVSVKTINKVWPGFIPLLEDGTEGMGVFFVSNIDWSRVLYPCLCAPKLDGVRGRYFYGKMYSRQGKIILGLEHIEKECALIGDDLDGELMVNSSDNFDSASGLIRNSKPVLEATYHLFDAPGIKESKEDRFERLSFGFQVNYCESIKLIPHHIANSKADIMDFYNAFLGQGYEGLVLYDSKALYENKRGKEMMRIVPIKSADCKVIGFEEGKGKFAGNLGKIIVDYKGKECKVGSGFKEKSYDDLTEKDQNKISDSEEYDKKVRMQIWYNQEDFLGKIACCEFKEESKNGVMRQPRFKGWREDKNKPNWD
jgi:DNA ligase-1